MINYVAIIVAAVASMAIGFVWYGPLFGKQWMKMAGLSMKDMKKMKMTPMMAMSLGFVACLVTAYVLSQFVGALAITTWQGAHQFAFWAWIGLVAPVQLSIFLWEGKSFKLFLLNTAHNLIALVVMTSILAMWP